MFHWLFANELKLRSIERLFANRPPYLSQDLTKCTSLDFSCPKHTNSRPTEFYHR